MPYRPSADPARRHPKNGPAGPQVKGRDTAAKERRDKKGVAAMFLDLRDQWPPVPPPTPLPASGKPHPGKRGEHFVGLLVACNLLLLFLAPIAGNTVVQAIVALIAALHR
jgi:hypothetical protein